MACADYLIVGSGFFGATFARIATDSGKKCVVIEKNNYVGGMAADSIIEGQIVGTTGAHILHSHSDEIWSFLQKFCEIIPFINKPKVLSGNQVYSFPINMMTLHQLWSVITPAEARKKLNEVRIPCQNPRNFEEWVLDKVGREIYEKFIYGYTRKNWGREPKDLPSSIIQRLPIRLTYEENYFTTKHQGMPAEGYTKLIETMLDGIEVKLGVDFFSIDWKKYANHLVFTGCIDHFFDYTFGKLDYRSLEFKHEIHYGDYQGNAVFNHVDFATPYLRSIENKHFYQSQPKHYSLEENKEISIITFDYPAEYDNTNNPFYPVRDDKNSETYNKYHLLKKTRPDVTFGGRLAEFKYLDIDQTIASAIAKAKK